MKQHQQRPSVLKSFAILLLLVIILPFASAVAFQDVSFLAGFMLPVSLFVTLSLWSLLEVGGQLFTLLGRLIRRKPVGDLLGGDGGRFTAVLVILPPIICALFGLLAGLFSDSYTIGRGIGLFAAIGLGYGLLLYWAGAQGVLNELD